MRILLLNFEKGWRGGERQTLISLEEFRNAGNSVALLARKASPLAQQAKKQGFIVFEEANVFHVCARLVKLRNKFDIFHAQTANTLTWLAILKPILKGIVVFTRRTSFPINKRVFTTKWKWQRVDLFIAISNAAAKEPARLNVKVHSIIPSTVNYIEADTSNIKKLTKKYVKPGQYVIATAAALTPEKDPITLIKAIHNLKQIRNDFVFLHFGGGGSCEHEARSLVQQLGLESNYKFVGFRTDITDCYRIMDVFVISSKQEALGSSVLDAFLYKVPVVATKAGGLKELVADGKGLACDVGSFECLANKINRLLNEPKLREQLQINAFDFVNKKHGVKQMAERYLLAYKNIRQTI